MKKAFFKVRISQGYGSVDLVVPALEVRLFQLVYDCVTSECLIEILDIHYKDLKVEVDCLSYGDDV